MIGYSTVTQKGQVTIPVDIREALELFPGKKVVMMKDLDRVVLQSVPDFFALRGSIKPKRRPEDLKAMRSTFIKHLSTRKK